MSDLTIFQWLLVLISKVMSQRDLLLRSLISGFMSSLATIFILLFLGVIMWAETDNIASLAFPLIGLSCTIPVVFIVMAITTYTQFLWLSGINQYIDFVGRRRTNRQNK
jgi:ABC-type spermidine/putrescine transport system permease subunit II